MSIFIDSLAFRKNFNFMKLHKLAFLLSLILSLVVVIMLSTKGLNLGIDFAGGIVMEFNTDSNIEEVRAILKNRSVTNPIIQDIENSNTLIVRLSLDNWNEGGDNIKHDIESQLKNFKWNKIDFVGPKVGRELVISSLYAMILALISMMLYVWLRFDWYYGIGVVVALLHDLIITLGFYLITGYEFDLTSVAVLLTVLGYSINDSVVIYDRIRNKMKENGLKRYTITVINSSLNETMSRTIMTVLTTVAACLALVLCGGVNLRSFSLAVLFGIIFGTYSSIFISAPILLYLKALK